MKKKSTRNSSWNLSDRFYLAGPDPGDQIPVIPENVEYLQDPSGVAKHGDAGIRDGQV